MKYILIIWYVVQGGVATSEFESLQACRHAGELAKAEFVRLGYVCVPKGNQ